MYTYISKFEELGPFIKSLSTSKSDYIAFDTETTGLDPFTDKLILVQIKLDEDIFIFNCVRLGDNLTRYIAQLLQDCGKILIGHNIKFDIKMVAQNTGELLTHVYDTMLMEVLTTNGLDVDRYPSLATLVDKYCHVTLDKSVRNNFIGNFEGNVTEEDLIYSALDVKFLHAIREFQIQKLTEQRQLRVVELESLLTPVVASMELNGVLLDKAKWLALSEDSKEISATLEKELTEEIIDKVIATSQFPNALEAVVFLKILTGAKLTKKLQVELRSITDMSFIRSFLLSNFNLGSHTQLLIALRDVYGIKKLDSTNEKVMNKFEKDYPIIKKIIEYREHAKKVAAFGEGVFDYIHPTTGKIHTNFNQIGARTGRFSSEKINLLNIPRDQKYREPFIASPGCKLISADFSQEELRLLAVVARVSGMTHAYANGLDLHTATASYLYDVPIEQVTKQQRSRAKNCNFAIGYGSTEYGLWKNFDIPMEEGKELLYKYYNVTYPEIRDFKKVAGDKILELGYSTTLLGRKRFFNVKKMYATMFEKDKEEQSILREGINLIIQGTGSDIIKKALVRLFYENPFGNKFKILLQVYDEIVVEVTDDIVEPAKEFVADIMTSCEREYLKDIIPSIVDVSCDNFWVH